MNKVASFAMLLILAACSGAKSTPIPSDPTKWEALAEDAKSLSDDDRRLLGGYLFRMGMGAVLGGSKAIVPPGTTIGDAIEAQKRFEDDQKRTEIEAAAVKAKADAQRAAQVTRLNQAATVVLTDMTVEPKNYDRSQFSDRLAFVYGVANKTGKEITGIKGKVVFTDQFGTEISTMGLSMDEDIEPHQTRSINGYGKDINEFIDADRKLTTTPFSKIKTTFVPEMIVFRDGSRLAAPGSEVE